jgi:putative nucleotidyltransferase with HDIG domain
VTFDVIDAARTEESKDLARQQVPNHYVLNTALIARITGALRTLYNSAQIESFEAYRAELLTSSQDGEGPEARHWELDEPAYAALHELAGEDGQARFAFWIERLDQALRRARLVRGGDENERNPPSLSNHAILIGALPNPSDEEQEGGAMIQIDKITLNYFSESNLARVNDMARRLADDEGFFPPALRPILKQILVDTLALEPLFKFDLKLTADRMEAEAAARRALLKYTYAKTELAPAEEPADLSGLYRLSAAHIERLKNEHERHTELLTWPIKDTPDEDKPLAMSLRQAVHRQNIGLGALLALIVLGMMAYCAMFQPRVVENPVRALSIAVLFLAMMAASRALYLTGVAVRYPMVLVAPVVMTAAILTIVYSQRFAIGMGAALALIVVLNVRGDLGLLVMLCTSMAVVVYQFREIRNRGELFSTGLLNGVAAFTAGAVVSVVAGYSVRAATESGVVAAIAAVLAIAIFFLILAPIERIFKIATNWTLLELLDTSRPLLTRLAQEAPGTYNHSLWLGALAEDACEVIGANGLLAKVGAMYHDIGKIHKAEYFVENQQSKISRHDKLAPTMSLLVIVGHVKDGVEMAKEYGLPPAIIRFIQEHHGTTVVRYFHHAATEQQKGSWAGRQIPEAEFRYPGPKPQSKETAVLMLCDGVEGAVRALPEPTPGRIENVVHGVLMDRLQDGQFDECDITLKELHKVEESLVKNLCRFYHGRVPYPKAEAQTGTHA